MSIDAVGIVGFNAIAMMRPHHPLFEAASDAPASGSMPPADFSANTVHDNSEFVDTGDVVAPSEVNPANIAAPQAPVPPVEPSQAQDQRRGSDLIDVEPQPLPAGMQPAPVAPAAPTAPVAPMNPFAAMADAIKAANPNLTTADIAQRAAAALQGAPEPTPAEPEVDPDAAALEDLNVRLEALRTQAETEGTSDYDADIQKLDREALLLQARLEVRSELSQQESMRQFSEQAAQWDKRAAAAYPDADIEGSPLNLAWKARADEIVHGKLLPDGRRTPPIDPDYFHRDPSAGFNLVAQVSGALGIAPKTTQQGGPPTPQTPQPIVAPPVMQGQQAPHRPAPQAPKDAMAAWLDQVKAAEQAGLGAEMNLARTYDQAFAGVSFAG